MYEINSKNYFNDEKGKNEQNNTFPNNIIKDKSFNNSFQKENLTTLDTTHNNINQKNNLSNFEKYKNQQLLNKIKTKISSCNCNCHIKTNRTIDCNANCHHCCHSHHFHIHHIHIPPRHFLNDYLNTQNLSEISNLNNSITNNSNNLLKEITELRNECKKFKEELDRNKNEKKAGNNYIKKLENKINLKNPKENEENGENNENNENNNKYHDMLDKGFEVINSVSNKCNDEKGKAKGGVYYYMNNDQDYDQLIQAQKNWIDNLSENNGNLQNCQKFPNFNNSISKTYSINDQNLKEKDLNSLQINNTSESNNDNNFYYKNSPIKGINNNKNDNKYYFDSKRNNNKGYIIKRGDKLKNRENQNNNINNIDNNPLDVKNQLKDNKNNDYNEEINHNNINDLNNFDDNNNIEKGDSNILVNNPELINQIEKNSSKKINNNKKENNNEDNNNIGPNNNNIDNVDNDNINNDKINKDNIINNNDNDNNEDNKNEEEEESNLLIERYLIIDEYGNPITVNGQKVLGMELIPLIGEDGKEVIDENGNILLIGPDGKPKSQDDLEPILLDNEIPLVNEENKPFLGLFGVPLINSEGNPIIGPGELYDNENKRVEGILGFVAKDKKGNPIKYNINEDNLEGNNDNNKINNNNLKNKDSINNKDKNSKNGKNKEDANIYNKLRPLLGPDGIPIKDSTNNHILLDENNIPVKNTGISLLLDKSGKPILNSLGVPILLDIEGKPLNVDSNDQNEIINLNKQFLNKNKNFLPPGQKLRPDGYKISNINKYKNNLGNRGRNNKTKNMKKEMNYSECNSESLKKINFLRPYRSPFYDDGEYKVNCFACDAGCGVSKTGYSPMNFSPYNNLIRRRDITPIRIKNRIKNSKNSLKTNMKKINV